MRRQKMRGQTDDEGTDRGGEDGQRMRGQTVDEGTEGTDRGRGDRWDRPKMRLTEDERMRQRMTDRG